MGEALTLQPERCELIHQRLTESLSPTFLEVVDESHKHIGHKGAQGGAGHYFITIASPLFKEKNLIDCHRMIYSALDEWMGKEIHALRMSVLKD